MSAEGEVMSLSLENTLEKLEITMIGKQYAELTLCVLLKGPRSVSSGLFAI